ncbi:MAG: GAF domain-containing protein [Betaproteobacteria bacterium]|nr:GAF domain-containing protein [Betaproteobacteria bacterium]
MLASQQNHGFELAEPLAAFVGPARSLDRASASQACNQAFKREVGEEPLIDEIDVVLPDGTVLCDSAGGGMQADPSSRPYFQKAIASPAVVAATVESTRNGAPRLLFARAERDASGRVQAVVVVSLDLARFEHELRVVDDIRRPSVGLVDSRGVVLAMHPDPAGWLGKDLSKTPFFISLAAHPSDTTLVGPDLDGATAIFGLARVQLGAGPPAVLWVGVPEVRATVGADREIARTVAAAAALLGLIFAGAWVAGEHILLRPLATLSNVARRVARGDLNARTGLAYTRDELGELERAVDDMARTLEVKHRGVALAARAVKVLSAWNLAPTADDEHRMLVDMCRALVEQGGYERASVAYPASDTPTGLAPVAGWGDGIPTPGSTAGLPPVPERELRLASAAMQRRSAVVANDVTPMPNVPAERPTAHSSRDSALISLPLRLNEAIVGVLTIASRESDGFAAQEAALMIEVAVALASSLGALRQRAEQVRLELRARRAGDYFRAAAEASLDALFLLRGERDPAGNYVDFSVVDMNSRAARHLRAARRVHADTDAATPMALSRLIPEAERSAWLETYARVAATGKPFEGEFALPSRARGTRWFKQQVVPIEGGVAVTVRDVTAHKARDARIRKSEEQLRLAMSTASMGAWSIDFATRACSSTEGVNRIFGLAADTPALRLEDCLSAVHPEERPAFTEAMRDEWSAASPGQFEFRVVRPDGTVHWVEGHSQITRDTTGRPVRKLGVFKDITKRRLDEALLRTNNRALKTLSAATIAVVRAREESALLHKICEIFVDIGGYRLVVVAMAQDGRGKPLVPVAWAGAEQGYFNRAPATWTDTEDGQVPAARAVRTGATQLAQNIASDASFGSWRTAAVARGFGSNLALPLMQGEQPFGVLSLYAAEPNAFDAAEITLMEELANTLAYGLMALRTVAERDRMAHAHQHHEAILRKSLENTIEVIAATVELRDAYTAGHQKRVARIAVAIGEEMGLSEDALQGLYLAAVVHDLGKVSVPAEILSKPGKLTPVEYALVKGHAQAGYDILKDVAFPWPIATVVWQHHERCDGSGYPQGLKGDEILLESRIIAVADVVEAMASHRPYRPTRGLDVTLQEIERGRGTLYDAAVVDACLTLFRTRGFSLPDFSPHDGSSMIVGGSPRPTVSARNGGVSTAAAVVAELSPNGV